MPSGRALRSWLGLLVQVGAILVVAASLQTVAERTNRRFDWTAEGALTLPPVTAQALDALERPLDITVFYDRGNRGRHATLLKRLAEASPQVETALYDLDRYPERARGLGVVSYGQAVLEYGGRRLVVPAAVEPLTGGILKLVRGRARQVAHVVGHREREQGGGAESYRRLMLALENENYDLDPLVLEDAAVPPGTDVVVVAGPRHDWAPIAIERLTDYVRRGGSVLLLLDPAPLPNLTAFLATLGVALGDDIVVDRERRILSTDGLAAVVEFFKQGNPITGSPTSPIDAGVVLPSARTVMAGAAPPGVTAESIARTGETAWAMGDAERARRGEAGRADAGDRPGPLDVMAMIEVATPAGPAGRVVVVGDADFASDAYFDLLGNANLVLNAVAWLAREDVLAGERATEAPAVERPLSPLVLTEDQSRRLLVSMVVVAPLVVLLLGAVVVGRRRWQG